jgi:hypothetical protein
MTTDLLRRLLSEAEAAEYLGVKNSFSTDGESEGRRTLIPVVLNSTSLLYRTPRLFYVR